MKVLAIDPGSTNSAYVVLVDGSAISEFGKIPNADLRERVIALLDASAVDVTACEQIRSYGMPVGAEVFDTVEFSGRLHEIAVVRGASWLYVPRLDVKMHACHAPNASDSNVRQALVDRFGGKESAVGSKKTPGPLYGVTGDVWQALALAVTVGDKAGRPAAQG